MGLLEVVTSNAGAKADLKTKVKASEGRPQPASTNQAAVEMAPAGVAMTSIVGTPPALSGGEAETVTSMVDSPQSHVHTEASRPDALGDASDPSEEVGPSTLGSGNNFDASAILANLPEPELRNLCKLLAQEG